MLNIFILWLKIFQLKTFMHIKSNRVYTIKMKTVVQCGSSSLHKNLSNLLQYYSLFCSNIVSLRESVFIASYNVDF